MSIRKMLYIMRHFQSEMNAQDLLSGRTNTPLTEKGYTDAQKVGITLSKVDFDYGICSTLSRAKESLKEVLKHQQKEVAWEADARIIEFDFGDFEALSVSKLIAKNKDFNMRYSTAFDAKAYNMESVECVHKRVENFLDDITNRFKGKNVLVVSHNGAIRVMKRIINKYPNDMDLLNEGIDNGQVLTFDIL